MLNDKNSVVRLVNLAKENCLLRPCQQLCANDLGRSEHEMTWPDD